MHLQSPAYTAALFQQDPRRIEEQLRIMEIRPELILNDLAYYKTAGIERAARSLCRAVAAEAGAPTTPAT